MAPDSFPIFRGVLRAAWWLSAVALTVLSLTPKAAPPMVFPLSDKVVHVLAYVWLGGLARAGWLGIPGKARRRVVLVTVLLAVVLELGQAAVPGRAAGVGDMAANLLGAACGLWVGARMVWRTRDAPPSE